MLSSQLRVYKSIGLLHRSYLVAYFVAMGTYWSKDGIAARVAYTPEAT